jgi:hypothetical protein
MIRFAIGAAYASTPHPLIHTDVPEFFASRAKVYLDIEMDSPTLATLQGLIILSAHEAGQARDSRGRAPSHRYVSCVMEKG